MSIRTVVTRGYGSGASISLLVLRGYGLEFVVHTAKGDEERRRIFKPTGLLDRPRKKLTLPEKEIVERRIEQAREVHEAILTQTEASPPIEQMSIAQIEAEIGSRLREKLRIDEEARLLLLLAAAGS